ncbi:MAG: glutaredoxin family protein [Colwellia sp.]|nr:glutaredoxin family protein [Colwellia sp.]
MTEYNLYGSEGCHLCEQALAICLSVLSQKQLNQIDIVDQERVPHESKTLVELYGVHIPVIEKLNQHKPNSSTVNQKLFWPFTLEQLTQLTQ